MKSWKIIGVIFFLCLIQANVQANQPIKKGEAFPDIKLPLPKDPSHLQYLGIAGDEPEFRIQDIQAEIIMVQIFHSG